MNLKIHEVIIREVDELVTAAERLARDASQADHYLGPDRVAELSSIAVRGGQLVQRIYPAGSYYERHYHEVLSSGDFGAMHSNRCRHVSQLAGILKGIQHDLRSGMLDDVRQLLRAEIFVDFIEMAEHLLKEGYKDAAAVIIGAILEDSLRKIAIQHGISIVGSNGKPMTIDPLNTAIVKQSVYTPLVQKQVTSWASLRNHAAHGDFGKYTEDQVQDMLHFVQKFCAEYLK